MQARGERLGERLASEKVGACRLVGQRRDGVGSLQNAAFSIQRVVELGNLALERTEELIGVQLGTEIAVE